MNPYENENILDRKFKERFDRLEVSLADENMLWSRISKGKELKRRRIIPIVILLFMGIICVGFFIKDINEGEIEEHIEFVNHKKDTTVPVIQDEEIRTDTDIKVRPFNLKDNSRNSINNAQVNVSMQASIYSITSTMKIRNDKTPSGNTGEESLEFIDTKKSNIDLDFNKVERNQKLELEKMMMLNHIHIDPLESNRSISVSNDIDVGTSQTKRFFIEGYQQVAMVTDKVEFEEESFSNRWSDKYTTLGSWHTGLLLSYKTNNRTNIQIGVEYQRIDVQFEEKRNFSMSSSVYDPEAYLSQDTIPSPFIGDTINRLELFERTIRKKGRHDLINLRMGANWKVLSSPICNLEIGAAMNFNISHSYSGPFLDFNLRDISIDNDIQSEYLKRRIGFSPEIGLLISKNLSNRFQLYLNGNMRFNNQSYTSDIHLFRLQTPEIYGIRLGLRWSL